MLEMLKMARRAEFEGEGGRTASRASASIVEGLVLLGLVLPPAVAWAGAAGAIPKAKADLLCAVVKKVDVEQQGAQLTDASEASVAGCMILGFSYEDGTKIDEDGGKVIPRNYSLALDYYETACGAGSARGCLAAGLLVEKGLIPPKGKGTPQAVSYTLYSMGCYLPKGQKDAVGLSCTHASRNLFRSAENAKGPARTEIYATCIKLEQKACDLGRDESCQLVAKIRKDVAR
jgi:hypothetical protein